MLVSDIWRAFVSPCFPAALPDIRTPPSPPQENASHVHARIPVPPGNGKIDPPDLCVVLFFSWRTFIKTESIRPLYIPFLNCNCYSNISLWRECNHLFVWCTLLELQPQTNSAVLYGGIMLHDLRNTKGTWRWWNHIKSGFCCVLSMICIYSWWTIHSGNQRWWW